MNKYFYNAIWHANEEANITDKASVSTEMEELTFTQNGKVAD